MCSTLTYNYKKSKFVSILRYFLGHVRVPFFIFKVVSVPARGSPMISKMLCFKKLLVKFWIKFSEV